MESQVGAAALDQSLDHAGLLDRMGGDEDLLREITGLFLEEYPTLVAQIDAGLVHLDPKQVEFAAHTLKGAVANFGMDAPTEAAYQLEQLGRRADLTGGVEALAVLENQLERLRVALLAFVR
jgi:HPt (histidine-containing phosphotransfer) domain-containing protein